LPIIYHITEKHLPYLDNISLLYYICLTMNQLVTISSKRQLTIPISFFNYFGLKKGQKLLISTDKKSIRLEPAENIVSQLAGSVKIPPSFQGLPVEKIIAKAKKEYFSQK